MNPPIALLGQTIPSVLIGTLFVGLAGIVLHGLGLLVGRIRARGEPVAGFVTWRRRAIPLILLALVIGSWGLLATLDGGAPPQNGAYAPHLDNWRIISLGQRNVGGVVCDMRHPCRAGAVNAVQQDGAACTWIGRLWLSSRANPVLMRDVRLRAYVSVRYPIRQGFTAGVTGFALPWHGGWWWRAGAQRIDLAVPLPCGGLPIQFSIDIRGKRLFGGSFHLQQGN